MRNLSPVVKSAIDDYFYQGAPPWPLTRRRQAERWWMDSVESNRVPGPPPYFTAIRRRQESDNDWVDLREVRDLRRRQWKPNRRSCGCARRGGGVVYVMRHEPFMDRIKIGKTTCVELPQGGAEKRARQLSCQAGLEILPIGWVELCCYEAAGQLEKRLHALWNDRQIITEWFTATTEEANAFAAAVTNITKFDRRIDDYVREIYRRARTASLEIIGDD